MKISNVIDIFDNGDFVTIVTKTGTAIHLPSDAKHSIVIHLDDDLLYVIVDLFEGI